MAAHQLSESVMEAYPEIAAYEEGSENLGNMQQLRNQTDVKMENGEIISVEEQNVQVHQNRSLQVNSSDSDWKTTTDTSIHSSPSDHEISYQVLEVCDGMDEMSLASTPSPLREASRDRDLSQRRGRGRGYGHNNTTRGRRRKSFPVKKISTPSSDSGPSRSSNSDSSSISDSTSCTGASDYSCDSDSSVSDTSKQSTSTCTDPSCSCSCHEDESYDSGESSTSYESNDDLTNLPRVKRGGRLGHKASKKVAKQCTQS